MPELIAGRVWMTARRAQARKDATARYFAALNPGALARFTDALLWLAMYEGGLDVEYAIRLRRQAPAPCAALADNGMPIEDPRPTMTEAAHELARLSANDLAEFTHALLRLCLAHGDMNPDAAARLRAEIADIVSEHAGPDERDQT